jgi:DNA repair protein RadC
MEEDMNKAERAKQLIDEGNYLDAAELLARAMSERIATPLSLKEHLTKWMFRKQEYFLVCTLDTNDKVIKIHEIARGTVDAVTTHSRDIFRVAILDNAKSIILVHNHPRGDAYFSHYDKKVTASMIKAGEVIGIPVIDHIIIYGKELLSAVEVGLIKQDIQ